MQYNTLFVGMDVHKESFTLCCYDMSRDKVSYYNGPPVKTTHEKNDVNQ